MMEMSPCKGCTNRHTACHGECEIYKAWRDRYQAQQKHLDAYKHRWSIPRSAARERTTKRYLKYGEGGFKTGGCQ